MKKVILFLVLAVLSLNLFCAAPDYSMIPPQSLPTFTGSLDDPQVNIDVFWKHEMEKYLTHSAKITVMSWNMCQH